MINTKKASIIIIRGSIVLAGLCVLALCIFVLPAGIGSEIKGDFDYGPIMVGVLISAIPLFFALHQSMKLLSLVDKGEMLSISSSRALKNVKYCAYLISGLYAVGMPYIFFVADRDDAPGVVALGLVIIVISFVTANVANLFQITIQKETN